VRDDAGQTLLIVAGVLMVVALSAAALFLSLDTGKRIVTASKRECQPGARSCRRFLAITAVHSPSGTNGTIPCPSVMSGTVPDGRGECLL